MRHHALSSCCRLLSTTAQHSTHGYIACHPCPHSRCMLIAAFHSAPLPSSALHTHTSPNRHTCHMWHAQPHGMSRPSHIRYATTHTSRCKRMLARKAWQRVAFAVLCLIMSRYVCTPCVDLVVSERTTSHWCHTCLPHMGSTHRHARPALVSTTHIISTHISVASHRHAHHT